MPVYRLPNGKFRVFVYVKTVDGYQHRLTRVCNSEEEARLVEAALKLEVKQGNVFTPEERYTLAQYLEAWLNQHKALKYNTRRGYESILRQIRKSDIGSRLLSQITPGMIKAYIDSVREQRSSGTALNYYRFLHVALESAVKEKLIKANPVAEVKPPDVKREKRPVLVADQIRAILDAARKYQNGKWYSLILTAISCSVRIGELFGLRWQDVDLQHGIMFIRQALVKPGTNPLFDTPKSQESQRAIALTPAVVKALREQRERVEAMKRKAGNKWREYDLVFPGRYGNPLHEQNWLRRVWSEILTLAKQECQIPDGVSPHALRHTWASTAAEVEVHPKIAQTRLGHADVQTTLDIYSRAASLRAQRQAALQVEAALGIMTPQEMFEAILEANGITRYTDRIPEGANADTATVQSDRDVAS